MSAAQATPPPVSPSPAESSSRAGGTPRTHFPHFILHPIPPIFTQTQTVRRSPGHIQSHPCRSRPNSRWRWDHVHRMPGCRPNSSHDTRQNNLQHKITVRVSVCEPGTSMKQPNLPSRRRITPRAIALQSPYSARASRCLRSETLAAAAGPHHPAPTPVLSLPHPPSTDPPRTAPPSTPQHAPNPQPIPPHLYDLPNSLIFIHGHRISKAPHPVRSAQLTGMPPS